MNRAGFRTAGYILMVLIGLAAVLLPLAGLLVLVLVAISAPSESSGLPFWAIVTGFSAAGGVWIAAEGFSGLRGKVSRPFVMPGRWLWLAAFIALLIAMVVVGPQGSALRGIEQILAALLPGLALLAFVSHRLRKSASPASWRQAAAETGLSLTLSMGWSVLWEVGGLIFLALAAGVVVGLLPGGTDALQSWSERYYQGYLFGQGLADQPAILAVLLALAAGITPVIEETGKALSVGLLALARRPSRAQAVTWGIVTGTTFAIVETALANPFAGTSSGAVLAVLRVGALLVHASATGLSAFGIYEWASRRKPQRFLLAIALSIGLHAAWNALAIAQLGLESVAGAAYVAGQVISLGMFALIAAGALVLIVRATEP